MRGKLDKVVDFRDETRKKRIAIAIVILDQPGQILKGDTLRIGDRSWEVLAEERPTTPRQSVGVLLPVTSGELRPLIGQPVEIIKAPSNA